MPPDPADLRPAPPGPAPELAPGTPAAAGPAGTQTAQRRTPRRGRRGKRDRRRTAALTFAILSGLLTHGYHLFQYPLDITDEGIYVRRAWAVADLHRLSPFVYIYDHAPAGWILAAGWVSVLPHQFETFGNAINTGRVLMLLLHAASVFFLFEIARNLSGGLLAPLIATFFFNFSPLAIYYQRMVLLDNIMVFWVLLSIYLLLRCENRLLAGLWSGLAFGISVVSKENAIFFAPTIFYLLARRARGDPNRRFTMMFWLFAASVPVSYYFLLATLKGELFPPGFHFNTTGQQSRHVSLLYEIWYQLHRNQGTLFRPGSFLYTMWLPKDGILLAAGAVTVLVSLYLGIRDRERNLGFLTAGTLAAEIGFYLARGSVILDFYVIPLIPMLALNIGLVMDRALKRLPVPAARIAVPVAVASLAGLLLLPSGGYLLTHGQRGQLQMADVYYLPLNYLQQEQVAWIREHIPPTDKIIIDDQIWMQLHDVRPYYPYAQSHWNAASTPSIRDKMFGADWQNIDYIVLSNGMRRAMIENNAGGQENWIIDALDNHSSEVWQASRGNVKLAIYQVLK